MILLVVANLVAWILLIREWSRRGRIGGEPEILVLLTAIAWGVQTVAVVELTSILHAFHRTGIALATVASTLGVVGAWWILTPDHRVSRPTTFRIRNPFPLAMFGVVLGAVLLVGILTPSSAYDGLTYHMPRVMHWIRNQSVDHYATTQWRQIILPPFNAYAIAVLFLSAGVDHVMVVPQWIALVGTAAVLPVVVRLIRPGITPIPAVAFAISVPMSVLQATTPQNDMIAAFWVLCLIALLLMLVRGPWNATYAGAAGAVTGLAALTKSTTLMFGLPFIGLALGFLLWKTPRKAIALSAAMVVGLIAINAPFLYRNREAVGALYGPAEIRAAHANDRITPAVVASNLIRSASLYTWTGSAAITRTLNSVLAGLHSLTGLDLNDPGTSFCEPCFEWVDKKVVFDGAANPIWHAALALFAFAAYLFTRERSPLMNVYAMALVLSALMFCATMTWQPWLARFHVVWFVAAAPFVGIVLGSLLPYPKVFVLASAGFTAWILASNGSRPLLDETYWKLPREQKYFVMNPAQYEVHRQKADALVASGCTHAGLMLRESDWEYPLWPMLRSRGYTGRLQPVNVQGRLQQLEDTTYVPCHVIAFEEYRNVSQGPPMFFAGGGLNWSPTFRSAWPVEATARLWLGTTREEGVHVTLNSPSGGKTAITVDAAPGISRPDTVQKLYVEHIGVQSEELRIVERAKQRVTVDLRPGPNHLILWSPDVSTVPVQPNGDTRHLMVQLFRLEAAPAN